MYAMTELFQFVDSLDKAVIAFFLDFSEGNPLTPLANFLTNQHNFLIPMVLGYLAMIIWGGRRGRVLAILLVPFLLLSDVFTVKVIKPIFSRPRPLEPNSIASMPSAHATNLFGAALLFSLGWVRNLWGRIGLFFTAFIFAFTRIYTAKHYPSDMVAGALIGMLDALIVIWLYKAIRPALARRVGLFSEDIFISHDERGSGEKKTEETG